MLAFYANLYDKLPYDLNRDFVPVTLAVKVPELLVVHPALPVKTAKEFVALAKNWYGIIVAAATPKDIVAKLHASLVAVLEAPDTKQRFAGHGANSVSSTPEELAAFMREETIKWGKVIKTSGIKIDQ